MKTKKFNCNKISKRGSEFPKNLIAYPDNTKFAVDFLLDQEENSEVLQKISELCAKTAENVELWFSHKKTSHDLPLYLKHDAKYDDFKNLPLEVSQNVSFYQPYAGSASIRYITVRFEG